MFILDKDSGRTLQARVYEHIKRQILTGKLPPLSKLPSVRQLAGELAISRNTVDCVYDQLCTEGFIRSKPQSGYFVLQLEPEIMSRSQQQTELTTGAPLHMNRKWRFDFHPAALQADAFPVKTWRALLLESLKEDAAAFGVYGDSQGEWTLRCEIQRYLERFRGVVCLPEQIVISNGLQNSMAIIAQLLQEEHTVAAVEEPGHWIPRLVFTRHDYAVRSIPVREDGLCVAALQDSGGTIVYVTPSHQFPLGYVMPMENRLRLLAWAEKTRGVIIEDDYDSELRYQGKPIPALQGLDTTESILYLGTFSKVLSPALRVSYLVLPRRFMERYRRLFANYEPTVPLLEQQTVGRFMAQGHWERHIRRMRTIYRRKHDALLAAVEEYFGTSAVVHGSGAGLHIVAQLSAKLPDEAELLRRAQEDGIRIVPISATYQQADPVSRVMLGFGRMSPEELQQGVRRLAQLWLPR